MSSGLDRDRMKSVNNRVGIALATVGLFVALGMRNAEAASIQYSGLWGKAGERWTPMGRLPDFSFAGYQRGEKDLPKRAVDVSVKDFGAKRDGRQTSEGGRGADRLQDNHCATERIGRTDQRKAPLRYAGISRPSAHGRK